MRVVIHPYMATSKTYYGNKFWQEHQHRTQGQLLVGSVLTSNTYQPS